MAKFTTDEVNETLGAWLDEMRAKGPGSDAVIKALSLALAHVIVEVSAAQKVYENLETAFEYAKISIKKIGDHVERRDV